MRKALQYSENLSQVRPLPDPLISELTAHLPDLLQKYFRTLIVKSENDQAWKQTQLLFQDFSKAALGRIEDKTEAILSSLNDRKILEDELFRALRERRLAQENEQTARAELAALTIEFKKLREQVARQASEPGVTALSHLLAAGDLEGAVRVKAEQVDARRGEVEKLARDWFELGVIHELRFTWSKAFESFREAWRLKRDPEYGLRFALIAQRRNQFRQAAEVYQAVLLICRELAKANPDAYLPDLATTLNHLGLLYWDMQQLHAAEQAVRDAVAQAERAAGMVVESILVAVASIQRQEPSLWRIR